MTSISQPERTCEVIDHAPRRLSYIVHERQHDNVEARGGILRSLWRESLFLGDKNSEFRSSVGLEAAEG
jgi:hypothetical protein